MLSGVDYRPRVIDTDLRESLRAAGAVLLEGPRACGKTETARQIAASEVRLDTDTNAQRLASLDPSLILDGPTPRLIDEWQTVPTVWNHVRRAVDDRRAPGQFILTGSSVPADDETRHSGAGRFLRLRMRPMALSESGHSLGTISLRALLDGEAPRSERPPLTVPDIAERICIGGWPAAVDQPFDIAVRPRAGLSRRGPTGGHRTGRRPSSRPRRRGPPVSIVGPERGDLRFGLHACRGLRARWIPSMRTPSGRTSRPFGA